MSDLNPYQSPQDVKPTPRPIDRVPTLGRYVIAVLATIGASIVAFLSVCTGIGLVELSFYGFNSPKNLSFGSGYAAAVIAFILVAFKLWPRATRNSNPSASEQQPREQ